MKVLVTGATGYIGNRLVEILVSLGYETGVLVRQQSNASATGKPSHPVGPPAHPVSQQAPPAGLPAVRFHRGDITDPDSLMAAMKGYDQVYHAAAYARLWSPDASIFYRVNQEGTRNVLQAARNCGVRRVVHTSSTSVFGSTGRHPANESTPRLTAFENDYDLSKHLAEREVQEAVQQGQDVVMVNPTRVYGPGVDSPSNAITHLTRRIMRRQLVILPHAPHVLGNYAFIDDVVLGHIHAMQFGVSGERYILGGENRELRELFEILRAETGHAFHLSLPLALLRGYSRMLLAYKKLVKQDALFTPSSLKRFTNHACFDSSKAIRDLHYRITPLEEGLRKTIRSIQNESICNRNILRLSPVPARD